MNPPRTIWVKRKPCGCVYAWCARPLDGYTKVVGNDTQNVCERHKGLSPDDLRAEWIKDDENAHAALLAACKATERWLTGHGYDATKITVEGQLLAGLRAAIATVEAKEVAE